MTSFGILPFPVATCCGPSCARGAYPLSLPVRLNARKSLTVTYKGRVSRRLRKKVEMLFAHLNRILRLDRLRLRGPIGARDEFLLAATAQNLRKLAKLDL